MSFNIACLYLDICGFTPEQLPYVLSQPIPVWPTYTWTGYLIQTWFFTMRRIFHRSIRSGDQNRSFKLLLVYFVAFRSWSNWWNLQSSFGCLFVLSEMGRIWGNIIDFGSRDY
ncbi:hypothetical protein EYC84_008806 [Monilinia fructicola]|uniref:Uncharacterized protein n=1 Tax=Monilinia fructicola TaxID=38448 RepID=A0A5M9JGD8_MONFR|nr:hypothetical protein EYC84_008806 [Monilinia fructicola]